MNDTLPQAIEAILFATAQSYTFTSLAQQLGVSTEDVARAVAELSQSLEHHGIMLTTLNEVVTLVTRPEFSSIIEAIRKDELSKELSKASSETLAIIAYLPGVSKSQIEFIRGVNVSYTIRSLMMRGLIEQRGNNRATVYHPTLQLLEHFGVSSVEALPQYAETKAKIESLLTTAEPS